MTRFSAVLLTTLMSLPAHAANPLTPAEQTVCRNLSHCLSIVETHPHDSFDYGVLAAEFDRFGHRGRRALIRQVEASEDHSGHAADLLAIIADPDTVPALRKLSARSALAGRTVEAIETKLAFKNMQPVTDGPEAACFGPPAKSLANRTSQMPFFESRIAQADQYGAFRPSAAFRFEADNPLAPQYKSRAWLRAAVPVQGGWIAAYPDTVIHYDSRTGAPTTILDQCVSALFAKSDVRQPNAWAIGIVQEGNSAIYSLSTDKAEPVARLNGALTHATRLPDGSLCLVSDMGDRIQLQVNGLSRTGCTSPDETP